MFYVVFEGSFSRGDLTEGFLRYRFGGLIFEGAYTWRGLFSEFYGSLPRRPRTAVKNALKEWNSRS